ncbi:MAG: prepilin peptidase [Coriobacteriales bacterium]|jgi:hypothetical protein
MPRGKDPKLETADLPGKTGSAIAAIGKMQVAMLPVSLLPIVAASLGFQANWLVWAQVSVASLSLGLGVISSAWLSLFDVRYRRLPTKIVRPMYASALAFSVSIAAVSVPGSGFALRFLTREMCGLAVVLVCIATPVAVSAVSSSKPLFLFRRESPGEGLKLPKSNLIGGGDLRLILAIALQLGQLTAVSVMLSCALGLTVCAVRKTRTFPFGPCLALPGMGLAFLQLASAILSI